MSGKDGGTGGPRTDPAKARDRFERRAAALRENLRRRKAQRQDRRDPADEPEAGDSGAGPDDGDRS